MTATRRFPSTGSLVVGALVLVSPAALLLARTTTGLDPELTDNVFHFYIVSFTSFVALVVSVLLVQVMGKASGADVRALLLAAAFVAVAAVFTIHGLATPGILVEGFHPAISWSAWLSLLAGTTLFALAAFPPSSVVLRWLGSRRSAFLGGLAFLYLSYVAVVLWRPEALSEASAAMPEISQVLAGATVAIGAIGIISALGAIRRGGDWIHWLALANLLFFVEAQAFQLQPLWHLSWWFYHVMMLAAFLTTVTVLVSKVEELRSFHLTRYYAASSAVIIALLALVGGEGVVQLLQGGDTSETAVRWRAVGLSAVLLGGLFAALLVIVNRADHIISRRTRLLEDAYRELRHSEEVRKDLTQMVIHDLRSPLSALILDLDLIDRTSKGSLPDRTRRVIDRASQSTQAMMRMVNNILDINRMEAGELRPARQRIQPADIVTDAVRELEGLLRHRDLQVVYTVSPDIGEVDADRELIRRVLQNLVTNAVRYSPSGGVISVTATGAGPTATGTGPMQQDVGHPVGGYPQGPSIQRDSGPSSLPAAKAPERKEAGAFLGAAAATSKNGAAASDLVRFSVADEGPGIPSDLRPRIFDKFTQSEDEKSARRGVGLGLAFCRMAVEAHGGRIWVEDSPSGGSNFSFTLPAAV